MSSPSPVRVLEVDGGGMNRGGTETWLMHVLRRMDRQQFAMDFLVHTGEKCAYGDEILALGARIVRFSHPSRSWHSRPWQDARTFRRLLKEHGPYDIVHSHVGLKSGYLLRVGAQCGVPCRISHAHNSAFTVSGHSGPIVTVLGGGPMQWAYPALMRRWIHRHATYGLAYSGALTSR